MEMIAVLMGPAGSGKTTVGLLLSKSLGWRFHDADDDHSTEAKAKMRSGIALTEADRAPWAKLLRERIDGWLGRDESVVLACSALSKALRLHLSGEDERIRFLYLAAGREELLRRLKARGGHFFPPELLDTQLAALELGDDSETIDSSAGAEAAAESARRLLSL